MKKRKEDLEDLLILAEHELTFLTSSLEAHPEIATTPAGALLLSCLEGGMTMVGRLRDTHKVAQGSEQS